MNPIPNPDPNPRFVILPSPPKLRNPPAPGGANSVVLRWGETEEKLN